MSSALTITIHKAWTRGVCIIYKNIINHSIFHRGLHIIYKAKICGVFTTPSCILLWIMIVWFLKKNLIWSSNFFFAQLSHCKTKIEFNCMFFFFFAREGCIERKIIKVKNLSEMINNRWRIENFSKKFTWVPHLFYLLGYQSLDFYKI
jgi:hypothetical protein